MARRLGMYGALVVLTGCAATPAGRSVATTSAAAGEKLVQADATGLGIHLAYDEPGERRERAVDVEGRDVYLAIPAMLNGRHVESASVVADELGQPAVDVLFTRVGSGIMSRMTRNNLGRKLAIVVDGEVVSVVHIQSEVSRQARISGTFSEQEVAQIAASINRGRGAATVAN